MINSKLKISRPRKAKRGLSVIVGQTADASGDAVPLYRAERALGCATCGATIREGEIFTRRKLAGQSLRLAALCPKCAPLGHDHEAASEMIQNMLVSRGSAPPHTFPSDAEARRRKVAEQVEPRLGPALRFGRRKRS